MPLLFPARSLAVLALAAASAALPLRAAAETARLAMQVHVPAEAAIADVVVLAGEAGDLCAPGERLSRDGRGWSCESAGGQRAGAAPVECAGWDAASPSAAGAGCREPSALR
jgi:hypothetical protein